MIETIPKEFAATFPERVQKWVARGLSTGDVNRPKMEAAVRNVYKTAGLKEPEMFIWMESPYQGALASWMLLQLVKDTKVGDQVWDQVWDQFGDQAWGQVWDQVGDQVWGQVWGQVWDQVWDQVRDQVRDQFNSTVLSNIVYGQWESGWLSHVATLVELGTRLDEDKKSWLDSMIELCDSGWWFPYQGMVVMCSRPEVLRRDPQGRLHSAHGPAISWKDGHELHYFHGTKVPKDIIEHPESITYKAVMKERNSEVRRCMCEMMGWDKFVEDAKLKLVDECDDPANAPHKLRLFDIPEQIFNVPVRLLLMTNATPKRDGIVPLYGETVPRECKTAIEAVSWRVEVSPEEYLQLARAT